MSDKDNTLICNSKKNCYFFSCPPVNHPVRHKDRPIITVLLNAKTYFWGEKRNCPSLTAGAEQTFMIFTADSTDIHSVAESCRSVVIACNASY